jgi:hypothetical protein
MDAPALAEKVRTPHKLNRLVLAPSYQTGRFDSHAVDGPFLFHRRGRYYMTFIGWDKIGYRSGLASSQGTSSSRGGADSTPGVQA